MTLYVLLGLLAISAIGWYVARVERNIWFDQWKRQPTASFMRQYKKWDKRLLVFTLSTMVLFVMTLVATLFIKVQ